MNNTNRVALVAAAVLAAAFSLPAWAADAPPPTNCKDGTTSTATGRGACSGHGGVQKAAKSPAAASTANPAAAASASPSAPASAAAAPASPAAAAGSVTKTAPTATASNTDPTGATAKCKDGTYSKSQHHSGTCSSHGGVAEWLTAQ